VSGGPAFPGNNGSMLGAAMVTARVAAYLLTGFLLFTIPARDTSGLGTEAAVYALAGVLMAAWTVVARLPAEARTRYDWVVSWILGTLTVTTAAASALPSGGPLLLLSFLALVAAGGRTSLRAAWITGGLAAVAVAAADLAWRANGWTVASNVATVLVALLLGFGRRAYRIKAEQTAVLLAQAEQLRAEQARAATLDERARIAREIHDVLAHSLGALGVQIQLAQAVLTDTHDEARAVDLLGQAHRLATDGLAETRRAVHALRGQTPPLPEGLAELGADHQRQHSTQVTVTVTGEPRPLPPDAGLALTRTAQEALVNTAKHAPQQPVGITLDYAKTGTTLTVTSSLAPVNGNTANGNTANGHAPNGNTVNGNTVNGGGPGLATVNGGYGLAGIAERLLLLKGTLSAGPHGGDWIVRAQVPQ
jgi:signal transduction histidine kinase